MDFGQVLPWGLTIGQTMCLGIGGLMVLGSWMIITSVFRLSKNMLLCGVAAIMMVTCCASTFLAVYKFVQ